MMKELELEIEARVKVGKSGRGKVNRISHVAIEWLVAINKIVFPYCQKIIFQMDVTLQQTQI